MDAKINTTQFQEYLESKGLFRLQITQTNTGVEAVLRSSDSPNLSDFTQVFEKPDGTKWVRLSFKDVNNDSITKGFFNSK